MATFISTSLSATDILQLQNTSISAETGQRTVLEQQGVVVDSINKFLPNIKERDDQILVIVDQIKEKQNQLVTISQSAANLGCSLAQSVASLYSNHDVIAGVSTVIVGYSSITVGIGTIKLDELQAFTYPNLENLDATTNNPIENAAEVNLSSSTSGTGSDSEFEQNVGNSISPVYAINSTLHPLGQETACNNYRTQIDTLLSEIETLRATAEIPTLESEATTLKNNRKSLQLEAWSLGKAQNTMSSKEASNNEIIDLL